MMATYLFNIGCSLCRGLEEYQPVLPGEGLTLLLFDFPTSLEVAELVINPAIKQLSPITTAL